MRKVCTFFLLAHRDAAHQNKGVPEGEHEEDNEEVVIVFEQGVCFLFAYKNALSFYLAQQKKGVPEGEDEESDVHERGECMHFS